MKTLNTMLLLLLSVWMFPAVAQDTDAVERLYAEMDASGAELFYSYETRISGIKTVGEGVLRVQGDMWTMSGNGLEMWCDGFSVWVADPKLKEVVIEPASSDMEDRISNPAILFTRVDELFEISRTRTMAGECMLYVLTPRGDSDMAYCNLMIHVPTLEIRSGEFIFNDGNVLKVDVSSMSFVGKSPVESFRPSISFGADWIVTDLR